MKTWKVSSQAWALRSRARNNLIRSLEKQKPEGGGAIGLYKKIAQRSKSAIPGEVLDPLLLRA